MNMGYENIELAIVNKIRDKAEQGDVFDLQSLILDEINRAGYLREDWQKRYAQERIEEVLLKVPEVKKDSIVIPTKGNLIASAENSGKLMYIKCNHCGYIGKPYPWFFRAFCGVFYLFTLLNIIGILAYFTFTNPYICANCNERDKLVKILNNRKEIPVKSFNKNKFETISVLFLIIGTVLLLLSIQAGDFNR